MVHCEINQSELLEEQRLEDLRKKHPEFLGVTIELYVEKVQG